MNTSHGPDAHVAGRVLTWALLGGVLALGFGLRWHNIAAGPLWADEAESSINALTILEGAFPRGYYLGIPIYENTLIRRWPGNPEYDFRDISYSDKGLATYHQWLPLYAMAVSFQPVENR